ncbi:MAG: DNA photolyase family protein [Sulfuritalea sp.]|jgi:deoxyribodipyrimidine photo-lyase|nr:DNA photolyase family protein [Sulfuritalea sp.]
MSAALVWFRRDLRAHDHAALHHALKTHRRVYCVFVFDTTILDSLPRRDRRVEFILRAVEEVAAALREMGGALIVRHGDPLLEIQNLATELGVTTVYVNRDYEPAAIARDAEVKRRLASADFVDFKDQVIFDRAEVMTRGGTPFSVFTPYKNAWLKKLDAASLQPWPVEEYEAHLAPPHSAEPLPTLQQLGFEAADPGELPLPTGMSGAQALFRDFIERIDNYAATRDFPAINGTSHLSAHLRFGTISIRQLAAYAQAQPGRGAATWLTELIWRDFYHAILWHHPRVTRQCFKPACDALRWDAAPNLFQAWCAGRTGYPLVDAAMRQLTARGYMHNRLRMITASFLAKDLGLDWRQGEAWFAEKLLDFDLAANNGGWQWAASTGCDAQPWFRIFNPVTQSEKFDPEGRFIRRYVPELCSVADRFIHAPWTMNAAEQAACGVRIGHDYPAPVVDHAAARARTLARFQAVRQ